MIMNQFSTSFALLLSKFKRKRQVLMISWGSSNSVCRYDMFNIRCRFAVFESSGLHYRTHTVFPKRHSDLDLAAPRKTYRGPHLETLYPEEDMTGCCPRRVLSVIEVPGLPEVCLIVIKVNQFFSKENLHAVLFCIPFSHYFFQWHSLCQVFQHKVLNL